MYETVGFIGCGNMGGALCHAAAKAVNPHRIFITDLDREKGETLAADLGAVFTDIAAVAENADLLFLAVKPQNMEETVKTILPVLREKKETTVLVTPAAGLSAAVVAAYAENLCPVIRIMPNTPVAVGAGMILYCVPENVPEDALLFFRTVLSFAGTLDKIPENKIDAASAISGCGPAYACLFIEALADAGVAIGLSRAQAMLYAEETLRGTAALLLTTGEHPAVMKDKVCSPGGTTIAGVRALEDGGFRSAAIHAVLSAYERTLELVK